MLKDSRSYEVQIIDAVRSVNRALGGTYGTSSAIGKTEFNQYEVQLIDAIKGIGRTLSGKGLSLAGGAGAGDLSGYATIAQFQDLSRRVTILENESFFRLVDGNVTLKEQYQNLWVPGWLAAGGIGTGGGGGGVSYLRELEDVYHTSGSGVLRADGTDAVPGDSLVYNSTLGWVAAPVSGGGGSGTVTGIKMNGSTLSPSTTGIVDLGTVITSLSGYATEQWVGQQGFLTASALSGYATQTWVQQQGYLTSHQTIYKLTLNAGTFTAGEYTPNSSAKTFNIPTTLDHVADGTNRKLSDYLPLTGGTMTGNIIMNGGSVLSATDSANQVGSVTNRFGNGFFRNLYTTYFGFRDGSDGSIQRGTIGMGDGYTNIYMQASDGTPYGQYSFNATYGFFHDGNGNVPCGRSDHRWSELWAVDAGLSGDLVLSTNAKGIYGTDTSGNARRLITLANDNGIYFGNGNASRLNFSSNGLIQFSWGTSGSGRYVSFGDVAGSAQSGACCYMPSIYPNLSSMDIGTASSRWRKIYAHDMDMSGDLSLASSSHIDIGPLRIEYDATNKALHITKKDGNDTNTYGIYADGFVSAGGVGQAS